MAVTQWRPLEEYHPAVRLMVRYMWRQEPPLLPSGFADRMGLGRQLVSRWLQLRVPANVEAPADAAADAGVLPGLTPLLAVRLARAMDLAPTAFLRAAGLCSDEEPLLAVEDAWAYVLARVAPSGGVAGVMAGQIHPTGGDDNTGGSEKSEELHGERDDAVRAHVIDVLERARTADLLGRAHVRHPGNVTMTVGEAPNHEADGDGDGEDCEDREQTALI